MTKHVPKILSALVGLVLLGVGAWLLVADEPETGGGLIAASLAILGGLGTVALPHLGASSKRPPPGSGLVLLLVVLAASAIPSGCGASAYGTHARAAHLTAIATDATGEVIDAARDHALDEVEEAHPMHGSERTAALEAEAARWRPAGQTLDALREALLTWGISIEAAHALAVDGSQALWSRVLALAAEVARLYGRVAALARELGEDVPGLPDALRALLAMAGAR